MSLRRPGELPYPQPHKAARDLLQNLLSLSSTLCSDGELTPTQAWHHIRHQPNFGGIQIQSLRLLAERLLKDEKCHGYVHPPNIWQLICRRFAERALGTALCCKPMVFKRPPSKLCFSDSCYNILVTQFPSTFIIKTTPPPAGSDSLNFLNQSPCPCCLSIWALRLGSFSRSNFPHDIHR